LRDERATLLDPTPTRFGFKLAGNPRMANGSFEKEEIGVFEKYLQQASTFIDIGANIGFYTCLAATRRKQVVAVEPLASNLRFLYKNLVCNELLDVEVFPLGLSGKAGIERLFGVGTGASFLPGWAGGSEKWYEVVPVSTLDIIANARFDGRSLLIKMDVEGFEAEVLKGAQHSLGLRPMPTWLVEICLNEHFPGGLNENFRETFQTFWSRGYQARVANDEERPVHPDDVSRWAKQGYVDFGSHNYLFV
jgi:FkbM family methyltransferase